MNREIKFRAWDYFNEVMIYDSDDETDFKFYNGTPVIKYVTEQHTVENGIDIDRPVWNQVDGPVMQYTGLKDKNGKEIYEGDIIKVTKKNKSWHSINEFTGVVEFDNSLQYIVRHKSDWVDLSNPEFEIEIIGNIYQNPELLK